MTQFNWRILRCWLLAGCAVSWMSDWHTECFRFTIVRFYIIRYPAPHQSKSNVYRDHQLPALRQQLPLWVSLQVSGCHARKCFNVLILKSFVGLLPATHSCPYLLLMILIFFIPMHLLAIFRPDKTIKLSFRTLIITLEPPLSLYTGGLQLNWQFQK